MVDGTLAPDQRKHVRNTGRFPYEFGRNPARRQVLVGGSAVTADPFGMLKNLKFAGRVGTGFSEKLLRSLFDDLQKIRDEVALSLISRRPDATVGTRGNCRRNAALPLGKTVIGLPSQIHGMRPG